MLALLEGSLALLSGGEGKRREEHVSAAERNAQAGELRGSGRFGVERPQSARVVTLKGCGREWCTGKCSRRAGAELQGGMVRARASQCAACSSKLEIELFSVFECGLEESRLLKVVSGMREPEG